MITDKRGTTSTFSFTIIDKMIKLKTVPVELKLKVDKTSINTVNPWLHTDYDPTLLSCPHFVPKVLGKYHYYLQCSKEAIFNTSPS